MLYSVVNPKSLEHVKDRWLPEISLHAPGVPWLLVGSKSDLRENREVLENLRRVGMEPVSEEYAASFAKDLGAAKVTNNNFYLILNFSHFNVLL